VDPPTGNFWFGTDRLWTVLPNDGIWQAGRIHGAPSSIRKLSWWRDGYDAQTEQRPNLIVTGRRLDGPASTIADKATNMATQPAAMLVGITFPTVGCWEVTGRYGDDELKFVVWIASPVYACDSRTVLRESNPAYSDAMALKEELNRLQIRVQCVSTSKMAGMFDGQPGAAVFRTDAGDFEALFLANSETWDGLKIVENHELSGLYEYRFEGTPRYSGTWGGRRQYFVRNGNRLLVTSDRLRANTLRDALRTQSTYSAK